MQFDQTNTSCSSGSGLNGPFLIALGRQSIIAAFGRAENASGSTQCTPEVDGGGGGNEVPHLNIKWNEYILCSSAGWPIPESIIRGDKFSNWWNNALACRSFIHSYNSLPGLSPYLALLCSPTTTARNCCWLAGLKIIRSQSTIINSQVESE